MNPEGYSYSQVTVDSFKYGTESASGTSTEGTHTQGRERESGGRERAGGSTERLTCDSVTVLAALGCDETVGSHLEVVAQTWLEGSSGPARRARPQLVKQGIDADECNEIYEKLQGLAQR